MQKALHAGHGLLRLRRRWLALALLALALCVPVVRAADEDTGGAEAVPAVSVQELQGRLSQAADPVQRRVLSEEIRGLEATNERTSLSFRQAKARTDAAEEANRLLQLQLDLVQRSEDLPSVTACNDMLRHILREKEALTVLRDAIRARQVALAEQKRTVALLAETAARTEAASREGTLEGVPALADWDATWQGRFAIALAVQLEQLDQQRVIVESLDTVAEQRMTAIGKALAVLEQKHDQVTAVKDRLFWQRESLPYSLETVDAAWADVRKLAVWLYDLLVSVPSAVPTVAAEVVSPPLLWQFLGSCALLAGGVFFVFVLGHRIRSWLEAKMKPAQEKPKTWQTRLALLGLRCVHWEVRYWLALSLVAGAWLMFVTLQSAYIEGKAAEAAQGAAITEGLSLWRTALALWFAYLIVGAYRLARRIIYEGIAVREEHMPLFPLPTSVARHLARGLRAICVAGAAVLLPIAVLTAAGYRPEVVSLLWMVLRVIIIVSILWPIARRHVFERILSARWTLAAKIIYHIVSYLYIPAVIAVLLLLLFQSIGYAALSRSIIMVTIEAVLVFLVIGFAVRVVTLWLRKREQKLHSFAVDRPSLEVLAQAVHFIHAVLHVGGLALAVYFVARLLWFHYGTAVFSPEAPAFVRLTAERVAQIVSGLLAWSVNPMYPNSTLTPVRVLIAVFAAIAIIALAGPVRRVIDRQFLARTSMDRNARHMLSAVIVYALVAVGAIVVLNVSGVPLAGLGIFAGASGLAIGFGMQNILSNFVSGLIIIIERHIKMGDCVKVGDDLIGYVERINARSTTIATFDNYRVIIPNSEFVEKQVINWSTQDPKLRIAINVGIAYGSDTELATQCLLKVADESELILKTPAPEVRFLEFGDNSLLFQLLVWVPDVQNYYQVLSNTHFAIDREFRANGIEIAFPQSDLHLRSVSEQAMHALHGKWQVIPPSSAAEMPPAGPPPQPTKGEPPGGNGDGGE